MKSKYSTTGKNFKNKKVIQTKKINSKCDKSNPYNLALFNKINTNKDDFISLFDFVHTYNDIYYIIYINNKYDIIFINIIDNKIVLSIKNAHHYQIFYIVHYSDKINKRDLFASYSSDSLKLWDINAIECIAEIDLVSSYGDKLLNSLFFMKLKNQLYIVAPFTFDNNYEKIVLYDLKGIKAKEIKIKIKSKKNVFDTNCYYEQKSQKNYIFICGPGFLKSFDVNKNDIYKVYCDNDDILNNQALIYDGDKIIKLISAGGGMVRIWNFHSGALLNKIKINNSKYNLPKICIWNSDYLIGTCDYNGFKIFDFKNSNIPQTISEFGYTEEAKKIKHPIYGECLVILTIHGISRKLSLAINKSFL